MNNVNAEKWIAVDITVRQEAAEAVEFALNSLDALGTSISFRKIGQTESLTVTGYFHEPPDSLVLQDELQYALRTYGFGMDAIVSVENSEIENTDWLAEWKKHWKPTKIGRFVIAPPWADIEAADKIMIRIEPNMAFGTGTHETTQLCINAIDELYHPGDSFLDVGTGTGILAIAAAKLVNGESDFLGIDNDPDSVKIAMENAESNGVGFIEFALETLNPELRPFDFVCANLTIAVILPMLKDLLTKTRKTLVMSGILAEQEPLIVEALAKQNVENPHIDRQGEWISVTVVKA